MHAWTVDNMQQGLVLATRDVIKHGSVRSPRGMETYELTPAHLTLTDPTRSLSLGANRAGLNLAIGVAEGLQDVAGISTPDLLERIAKPFAKFRNEDDGELHGAYGPRLRDGLRKVVRLLSNEPESRQAVVEVFHEEADLVPYSSGRPRDVPCTLSLHFMRHDDGLDLHVTMRSNDVWLGYVYDVFQFAIVQCSVANALHVPVRRYEHHANSLHLYTRDLEKAQQVKTTGPPSDVQLHGVGTNEMSWEEITHRARQLLDGRRPSSMTESEAWMLQTLRSYV